MIPITELIEFETCLKWSDFWINYCCSIAMCQYCPPLTEADKDSLAYLWN